MTQSNVVLLETTISEISFIHSRKGLLLLCISTEITLISKERKRNQTYKAETSLSKGRRHNWIVVKRNVGQICFASTLNPNDEVNTV